MTSKGKNLVPILVEMILWSAQYDDSLNVPQSFIDKAKAGKKQEMVDAIMAGIA